MTWKPGAIPLMHVLDKLVLDAQALPHPKQTLTELFVRTQAKQRRTISPNALQALLDILTPKRTILALLSDRVIGEEQQSFRLQQDQYRKLDMMSHYPRVADCGAAGTDDSRPCYHDQDRDHGNGAGSSSVSA